MKTMDQRTVYLDNSATTQPFEEVIDVVKEVMKDVYGNPSSIHSMGIDAENVLKRSREIVASSLQVSPKELIFTSGGTEANNLALKGIARASRNKHIISSATEHKSLLNALQSLEDEGFEITYLPVDSEGMIDMEKLKQVIREDTALISVMHVNNETGTIQPIDKVAELIREEGSRAVFHVDAVQSFGKIPLHLKLSGVDLLTVSSHKIHGPKGVGALYLKSDSRIKPLMHGGGQEKEMRPGTENVPGIAGFAKAVEMGFQNFTEKANTLRKLKNGLASNLLSSMKDIRLNTSADPKCAPHILNVSFPGLKGEVLLRQLESSGVYVSTSSACTSGKNKPSHVLGAMGVKKSEVEGAIRFSFSVLNKPEDIEYCMEALLKAVNKLKKLTNI